MDRNDFDYDDGYKKTIVSSRAPAIIKAMNQVDPFIKLASPQSDASKRFAGKGPTAAQFCFETSADHPLLPEILERDGLGTHLTFHVLGGRVAKQICLKVKIAGANIKKLHECKLEFFAGTAGQIMDLSYAKKSSTILGISEGTAPTIDITWTTKGGYGTGLGTSGIKQDLESQRTLQHMKSLRYSANKRISRITLTVQDVPGLDIELKSLIHADNALVTRPWLPYLDKVGKPVCGWRQMPTRKNVDTDSGGLVRIPAKNSFTTPEEAYLILANGIWTEYRVSPDHDLRSAWPFTEREQIYFQQILKALEVLFDSRDDEQVSRWWPVILNQAPEELKMWEPLRGHGAAQKTTNAEWTKVETIFPWTGEQKAVLRASRKLPGGVMIIEGGPGSGKTVTLAGIAVSYLASGCDVLLFAATPAAANMLAQVVAAFLAVYDKANKGRDLSKGLVRLYPGSGDYNAIRRGSSQAKESLFSKARIIITNPNAVCSPHLTSIFGKRAGKIMIMHDDSYQILESELWASIFSLSAHRKVQGLVLTADVKEWPLSVATLAPVRKECINPDHNHWGFCGMLGAFLRSHREGTALPKEYKPPNCNFEYYGGMNEFAEQTGLPFVNRLLRQHFPSMMLKGQHRIKEKFAEQSNKLIYKGLLGSVTSSTLPSDVDRMHKVLRSWLGDQTTNKDMSVFFLEASIGKDKCIKERYTTTSKRNHRNVDVVHDMLFQISRARAIDLKDFVIVVQFKDQQRLYEQVFKEGTKQTQIMPSSMPKVVTLDTFRGNQARVVIFDLVITCGDSSHGLGIMANELRANIAATRATETFIIVGSSELVNVFPSFWRWFMERQGDPGQPLPYIVQYAENLRKQGLSFTPRTPERSTYPEFVIEPEWIKSVEEFLE